MSHKILIHNQTWLTHKYYQVFVENPGQVSQKFISISTPGETMDLCKVMDLLPSSQGNPFLLSKQHEHTIYIFMMNTQCSFADMCLCSKVAWKHLTGNFVQSFQFYAETKILTMIVRRTSVLGTSIINQKMAFK